MIQCHRVIYVHTTFNIDFLNLEVCNMYAMDLTLQSETPFRRFQYLAETPKLRFLPFPFPPFPKLLRAMNPTLLPLNSIYPLCHLSVTICEAL